MCFLASYDRQPWRPNWLTHLSFNLQNVYFNSNEIEVKEMCLKNWNVWPLLVLSQKGCFCCALCSIDDCSASLLNELFFLLNKRTCVAECCCLVRPCLPSVDSTVVVMSVGLSGISLFYIFLLSLQMRYSLFLYLFPHCWLNTPVPFTGQFYVMMTPPDVIQTGAQRTIAPRTQPYPAWVSALFISHWGKKTVTLIMKDEAHSFFLKHS